MENPFFQLDQRLVSIERKLNELNNRVKPESKPPKIREGGLALAMEVCHYSKSTIYKLVMRNAIPYNKRGTRLWFNELELIQWLENGMPENGLQMTKKK